MNVLSIVGARPQFIKAFPVSRELRKDNEEVLIHTGQHYDAELSDVFFDELGIPEPEYNLGVGSNSHGRQTAAMIEGIEELIETESPDVVLVYGDTNSTLAGAIAGSKLDPVVAHVEAGLRSFNREMPEEINRVLTDHAADLLFVPSESAVANLRDEGITDGVHVTGDVMYDAILWARERAREESTILRDVGIADDKYILSTVHRAGNTDNEERLRAIFEGLADAPLPVVLPLHPRTENQLKEFGLWEMANESVRIIDSAGYLDFVRLMDGAERIATDSGGVQKEAFYLDTPCVTMRDETEWVETVECGWNELVGADREAISSALRRDHQPESKPQPYGDGEAAARIAEVLTGVE